MLKEFKQNQIAPKKWLYKDMTGTRLEGTRCAPISWTKLWVLICGLSQARENMLGQLLAETDKARGYLTSTVVID